MDHYCPHCDALIRARTRDVAEGVALCPKCGKLSEVAEQTGPFEGFTAGPPPGCAVSEGEDQSIVTASLRSGWSFAYSLFLAIVWNGAVSVLAVIVVRGLYQNLVGPLPEWFPAPNGDEEMPLGKVLSLFLLLVPFVLAGAVLIWVTFSYAIGRIEVTIDRHSARIRTGFGAFNWTRKFDPRKVERVLISYQYGGNDNYQELIEVQADRNVRFGTMLAVLRRKWLCDVLQARLLHRDAIRK